MFLYKVYKSERKKERERERERVNEKTEKVERQKSVILTCGPQELPGCSLRRGKKRLPHSRGHTWDDWMDGMRCICIDGWMDGWIHDV
jgi:hypothetical protein